MYRNSVRHGKYIGIRIKWVDLDALEGSQTIQIYNICIISIDLEALEGSQMFKIYIGIRINLLDLDALEESQILQTSWFRL